MSEIKPGDYVKIAGQESIAQVLSIKGNDVELALGEMKVNVKKNKLSVVDKPYVEPSRETGYKSSAIDTKDKLLHFQFELDVRGQLKEDVIPELTQWVDDALLLGVEQATIIHGRGNGILRQTVRGFLRKYKEVSILENENSKDSDFITVVKFNG